VIRVQHHLAHVLSCMSENELSDPVLGVAWDGTGLGDDGTIWGGEFLVMKPGAEYDRFGRIRQFLLPGGDKAVREPRRSALAILYEMYGDELPPQCAKWADSAFPDGELQAILTMLQRRINSPVTSSAGRLFDAAAALLGLRHKTAYEGQAAVQLEFAARCATNSDAYPIDVKTSSSGERIVDWEPTIVALLKDIACNRPVEECARAFHNALVDAIVTIAVSAGITQIVLTGGCFQSRYLTERTVERLRSSGLTPYWHQRVPPNDGGIALGQLVAASTRVRTMGSRTVKEDRICA